MRFRKIIKCKKKEESSIHNSECDLNGLKKKKERSDIICDDIIFCQLKMKKVLNKKVKSTFQ